MPASPQLDGLPFSIQILLSVLFGVAALGAAFKGYFSKSNPPSPESATTATLAAATLMDNMSMRQLSDSMAHLTNDVVGLDRCVVSLERAMGENTHWIRQKFEQDREICQRLRELREETERLAAVTAARQKRERAANVRRRDDSQG